MKIPEDMHDRVFELVTDLLHASETDDMKEYWAKYNELLNYCESQSEADRDHPFLWEALADFTSGESAAIKIYLKALRLAEAKDSQEYEASIKFMLAERYQQLAEHSVAHSYAIQANEAAKGLDDLELRKSISEFLLSASSRTHEVG